MIIINTEKGLVMVKKEKKMYKAAKYYKGLNEETFTSYPQVEYKGKDVVLPMLSIDMETQLFDVPGTEKKKYSRLENIDTVTIVFEGMYIKTVYNIPIYLNR